MGADGWDDIGPWHDDPNESLRALQRQRLDQQYRFPQFVTDRLAEAREALALTRAGNDPPSLRDHLLDVYGADIAYLEGVQSQPLPPDLAGRLAIVRRVCGADGCGGLLDVVAVDSTGAFATARPLSADERVTVFGTAKPTAVDVRRDRGRLAEVGRAESYCYPVYDDAGTGVAWHFYGRTFD